MKVMTAIIGSLCARHIRASNIVWMRNTQECVAIDLNYVLRACRKDNYHLFPCFVYCRSAILYS